MTQLPNETIKHNKNPKSLSTIKRITKKNTNHNVLPKSYKVIKTKNLILRRAGRTLNPHDKTDANRQTTK